MSRRFPAHRPLWSTTARWPPCPLTRPRPRCRRCRAPIHHRGDPLRDPVSCSRRCAPGLSFTAIRRDSLPPAIFRESTGRRDVPHAPHGTARVGGRLLARAHLSPAADACFERRRWSRRDVEDPNIWPRSMGVHVEYDCDRFVSTWGLCRCTCCVKRSYACSATELSEFQCPGRAGHRAAAGRETILPGSRCRGDPRSPKGSRSGSSPRPNPS